MWIEPIKNKNNENKIVAYKYVERFEDPLTGKERRVSLTHPKKTKAVQEEMLKRLDEKIKVKLTGKASPYDKSTFSELIDEWLPIHLKIVKGQTKVTRKYHAKIFKERLGDVKMSRITPELLNRYLLEFTQKGLAYKNVVVIVDLCRLYCSLERKQDILKQKCGKNYLSKKLITINLIRISF